jgi:hypothetical protein
MPPKAKTIAELRKELRKKERMLSGILKRRKKILARLAKMDRNIMAMAGEIPAAGKAARAVMKTGRKGRARRRASGKPLSDYLRAVLAKNPEGLRTKDIAKSVVKAGYKSFSKNFYGIVAAALQDRNQFKRQGRGTYFLVK